MSNRTYYKHPVEGWGWHEEPAPAWGPGVLDLGPVSWADVMIGGCVIPPPKHEKAFRARLIAYDSSIERMGVSNRAVYEFICGEPPPEITDPTTEVAELRTRVACLKEGRDMLARKYDKVMRVIQHDTERLLSIRRERDAAIRERDEARREINNIHTRIAQLIGGVK